MNLKEDQYQLLQTKFEREKAENQELMANVRSLEDEIRNLKTDLEQTQDEKKMGFSEVTQLQGLIKEMEATI